MKDAIPGRTLSVAYGDSCSPFCRLSATSSPGRGKSFHSGRALGKEGKSRPYRSTSRRNQLVSPQTFRLCQSLSLSGEVARRSRDGEGCFQDEPSQSPAATAVPLFVACRRHLPPVGGSLSTQGEPLAKRVSFVLTGQRQEEVSRQAVNFSPLPKPLTFGRGGTAKP